MWWTQHLESWAHGRGYVAMSWDFRLAPPGEPIRPLCPDVAYLSYDRAGDATDEELQAPLIAPDVAIEVLEAGEEERYIGHKVELYSACGTSLFIVADPTGRTVVTHDRNGTRTFTDADVFEHPLLEGFRFVVSEMFDAPNIHR
jgi:Uma2 family endonuclease